ncbi:MAG: hypothetical protein AB2A00_06090 [Myxococcota bacterium]
MTRPLLVLLACALSACASSSAAVKPSSSTKAVIGSIQDHLTGRGFDCRTSQDGEDLACEADQTYRIVIAYRQQPARLLLYAWFGTDGRKCDELEASITQYNKEYPTQLSCITHDDGDTSLRFFTSTLLPEGGITATELADYMTFWSAFIQDTATEAGVFKKEKKPSTPASITPS